VNATQASPPPRLLLRSQIGNLIALAAAALAGCASEPSASEPFTSEASLPVSVSSSAAGGGTSGSGDRGVSITPAAGTLLVACASLSGNAEAAPPLTDDQGGSYALARRAPWGGGANNLLCYVREQLIASAVATRLTLDTTANTAGELAVIAYAGVQRTGATAIRQVASAEDRGASTAPSVTLPAAAAATNPTLFAVASGDTTTSPPAGWTERHDASQSSPMTALEIATRDGGFTGAALASPAAQSTGYAAIAIELDAEPIAEAPPPDGGGGGGSALHVGAHGIVVQRYGSGFSPAQITLDTAASGSTFLIAIGGRSSDIDNGPTDNKGNPYTLVGRVEDYADWPGYGTAVWIATNARGGAGHVWSQYVTSWDEVTMFAVELPGAGASPTVASVFSQRANAGATQTQTSGSVTTVRPAHEIALWFGAGPPNQGDHVATPNNGFTNLRGYGQDDPNGYVQAWMAYRAAMTAGTHNVTWTQSPIQGAQLRLVAIQP
jgi:hypothetical protein